MNLVSARVAGTAGLKAAGARTPVRFGSDQGAGHRISSRVTVGVSEHLEPPLRTGRVFFKSSIISSESLLPLCVCVMCVCVCDARVWSSHLAKRGACVPARARAFPLPGERENLRLNLETNCCTRHCQAVSGLV